MWLQSAGTASPAETAASSYEERMRSREEGGTSPAPDLICSRTLFRRTSARTFPSAVSSSESGLSLCDDAAAIRPGKTAGTADPPSPRPTFRDKALGDWGGLRRELYDKGITVGLDVLLEGFKNFHGGLSTSQAAGAPTLDLSVAFDTERLFGWHGGTLYGDLEYHGGQNPSDVLVGDLQLFDKTNSPPYFQFLEVYYQQTAAERQGPAQGGQG